MQPPGLNALEDAFGGLSLEHELNVSRPEIDGDNNGDSPPYNSVDIQADGNQNSSLYTQYRNNPANAFRHPIFYRVVHSDSPAMNVDCSLCARLFPAPDLELITVADMQKYISDHGNMLNPNPTPLISVTTDLIRAFNLAGQNISNGKKEVKIILIDPWKLPTGCYIDCNALRLKCGLYKDMRYDTETFIWAEVPVKSILTQWSWTDIVRSGLFTSLPSLNALRPWRKISELRKELVSDLSRISVPGIAQALVFLKINPSSFTLKQIFCFLLGQALNHPVTKCFDKIQNMLLLQNRAKLEEFDRHAHILAVASGKKRLVSYFQTNYASHIVLQVSTARDQYSREGRLHEWSKEIERKQRKLCASEMQDLFCPDFETWWTRREWLDLSEWEAYKMAKHENQGIQGWKG